MPRTAEPLAIRNAGLKPGQRAQTDAEKRQREDEKIIRNRKSAKRSRKKKAAQEQRDKEKMEWQDRKIANLQEALLQKLPDMKRLSELSDHQLHLGDQNREVEIRLLIATARHDDCHPPVHNAADRESSSSSMSPELSSRNPAFSNPTNNESMCGLDAMGLSVGRLVPSLMIGGVTRGAPRPTSVLLFLLDASKPESTTPALPDALHQVVGHSAVEKPATEKTSPVDGDDNGADIMPSSGLTYQKPWTTPGPLGDFNANTSFSSAGSSNSTTEDLNFDCDPLISNHLPFNVLEGYNVKSAAGLVDRAMSSFADSAIFP